MSQIPEPVLKKLVPNPKDGWPFGEGRAVMCLVSLAPTEPGVYEAPQVYSLANGMQLKQGAKIECTRHTWNKIKNTRSGDGQRGRPLFIFEEHPNSPTIDQFVEQNQDQVDAFQVKLAEQRAAAEKLSADQAAKAASLKDEDKGEEAKSEDAAIVPPASKTEGKGSRGKSFRREGSEQEVFRTDQIDIACYLGVYFKWEKQDRPGSHKVDWIFYGEPEDLRLKLMEYPASEAGKSHVVRRTMIQTTKPRFYGKR